MAGREAREALPYAAEVTELLGDAQRTALESTHATVTIEHLLLAFVDSPRAKALLQLDAGGLMALRGQIVSRLMQADGDPTTFGRVPPQDAALTEVLVAAERRARALGLHLVDGTSIVASLLESHSPVASWLRDLGVKVATPPPPPRASRSADALDAPWPQGLPAPAPLPVPPEDEDVQDTPTEEATMPADELEGPASLVDEPATDPDEDEDDFEEWAAPTKVAGGLERDRAKKEDLAEHAHLEGGESFAEHRPSLEPAPWNLEEFDDDVPTVNARPSEAADEEPTRVETESEPSSIRAAPPRSIVQAVDALEAEERADRGGSGRAGFGEESLSIPPPAPVPDIADGRLAENIPRRMRVGQPQRVQVRLGKDGTVDIRKGMRGTVTTHAVVVTQAMSARLVAPDGGFVIELTSPETQWIDDPAGIRRTPAEWSWTLTPTKPGKRLLQLVVGARTVHEGLVAEAALPLQIIEIEVGADHAKTAVQGAQWLAATVFGAVLGVFSEEILEWAQGVLGAAP